MFPLSSCQHIPNHICRDHKKWNSTYKGTKWGYHGVISSAQVSPPCRQLRQCTTPKLSTKSADSKLLLQDRNRHTNSRFPLMKRKVWGAKGKSGVQVRPANPRAPQGYVPVQDSNRWEVPLLSLKGQINIIKGMWCLLFKFLFSVTSQLFPKCYRDLMLPSFNIQEVVVSP